MLAAEQCELPLPVWLRTAAELKQAAAASGRTAKIALWGGEPLLYSGFDTLAEQLYHDGFELEIVTNGTLIDHHSDTLCECLDTIHVSLDGFGAAHDAVRGAGVFERVRRNLPLLKRRRGKLVFLCTISDANVDRMAQLPHQLAELGPDEIVLQQLMYLTGPEIAAYRDFSRRIFGCDYPELEAWRRDDDRDYLTMLREGVLQVAQEHYPVPVRFTPHLYPDHAGTPACSAPEHRVHIRHDGAIGFCTDYFGFTAGNICDGSLEMIFNSPGAVAFRNAVAEEQLPICRHCPWRLQKFV